VAHHDQGAAVARDQVVEEAACLPVEVVRRLVQQQGVRTSQQQAGESQPGHLPTAQLAEPAVQHAGGEAEPGQLRRCSLLDVPVVADRVVEGRVRPTTLDRAKRLPGARDPQVLVDLLVGTQHQVLAQPADVVGAGHGAAGGPHLSGEEPQQRGLAAAVCADDARATGWNRRVEVLEDDVTVGPSDRDVVEGEGGCRHGCSKKVRAMCGSASTEHR
jgi:hypothetical protein